MSTPSITPAEGQVWADNDRRSAGRTLLVTRVPHSLSQQRIELTTLTASDSDARRMPPGAAHATVGRKARVAASRLRPTSTGYRLLGTLGFGVDDVVATTPAGAQSDPLPDAESAARWLLAQEA